MLDESLILLLLNQPFEVVLDVLVNTLKEFYFSMQRRMILERIHKSIEVGEGGLGFGEESEKILQVVKGYLQKDKIEIRTCAIYKATNRSPNEDLRNEAKKEIKLLTGIDDVKIEELISIVEKFLLHDTLIGDLSQEGTTIIEGMSRDSPLQPAPYFAEIVACQEEEHKGFCYSTLQHNQSICREYYRNCVRSSIASSVVSKLEEAIKLFTTAKPRPLTEAVRLELEAYKDTDAIYHKILVLEQKRTYSVKQSLNISPKQILHFKNNRSYVFMNARTKQSRLAYVNPKDPLCENELHFVHQYRGKKIRVSRSDTGNTFVLTGGFSMFNDLLSSFPDDPVGCVLLEILPKECCGSTQVFDKSIGVFIDKQRPIQNLTALEETKRLLKFINALNRPKQDDRINQTVLRFLTIKEKQNAKKKFVDKLAKLSESRGFYPAFKEGSELVDGRQIHLFSLMPAEDTPPEVVEEYNKRARKKQKRYMKKHLRRFTQARVRFQNLVHIFENQQTLMTIDLNILEQSANKFVEQFASRRDRAVPRSSKARRWIAKDWQNQLENGNYNNMAIQKVVRPVFAS